MKLPRFRKVDFFHLTLFFILFACSISGYETRENLSGKASRTKLIALDVDGVLTNGEIAYASNGDEIKIFNVKDGFGLARASNAGFVMAIITGRASSMVERRGKELGIHHIYQNVKDKAKVIEELAAQYHLSLDEICYIGDDLLDLPALRLVGLACCPSDAVPEVREACSWISSYEGGKGAMRELSDFLISFRKPLD